MNDRAGELERALAEHERWLRTIIHARLRDPEATQEVMQNTALAVAAHHAKPPTNVGPWLYRVAVRQCLLYRRQCGRRRRLMTRYAEHEASSEGSATRHQPLDWLMAEEQREQIRETLSSLPRRDAEILLLKYGEGWDYRKIAQQLGISRSAVEARLHRARNRLRTLLNRLHDDVEVMS